MGMNVTGSPWADMGMAHRDTRKTALGQEDFLRLMTEQLKNQDPLKPLESNEFLGQMAQFSTVQGIADMQKAMYGMLAAIQDDQTLKAADMIGREVQVPSDRFVLAEGGMHGSVALPMGGDVTVEIKAASGEVIKRMSFPSESAGLKAFQWDGMLDDGEPAAVGTYTIEARVNSGGKSQPVETLVNARVESVSLSQHGVILNLFGLGPVPVSAVHQIG